MLNKGWGAFYEGDSIVHKLHPSLKIFGLFCFVLLCLLKYNNYLFIINIAMVFLLILFSNVDFILYLKHAWKYKFVLIIFYLVMYRLGFSLTDINIYAFKIVFLILYIDIIKFTTTRMDISKGIANIFNVFNFINYNLRRLIINLGNIFSFRKLFLCSYNEQINSLDVKGEQYTQADIFRKTSLFFREFKNIFNDAKNKYKERKETINKKFYDKKRIVYYKYLYKYKIIDYVFAIIYLSMIAFYILKVR